MMAALLDRAELVGELRTGFVLGGRRKRNEAELCRPVQSTDDSCRFQPRSLASASSRLPYVGMAAFRPVMSSSLCTWSLTQQMAKRPLP